MESSYFARTLSAFKAYCVVLKYAGGRPCFLATICRERQIEGGRPPPRLPSAERHCRLSSLLPSLESDAVLSPGAVLRPPLLQLGLHGDGRADPVGSHDRQPRRAPPLPGNDPLSLGEGSRARGDPAQALSGRPLDHRERQSGVGVSPPPLLRPLLDEQGPAVPADALSLREQQRGVEQSPGDGAPLAAPLRRPLASERRGRRRRRR